MNGKALREIIGFAGVACSLIFVGMEIRQNTLATRAAAYQHMGTAVSTVWLETAQDPVRSVQTLAYLERSDDPSLSPSDAQLVNQSIAALRQYEVMWRQVELGLLEEAALNYFGYDPREVARGRLWPRVRNFIPADFRSFLEASAEAQ